MKKVSKKKRASSRWTGKRALVDTPVKKLGRKETLVHYKSVLLEEIRSQMKLVIEGMESTATSIRMDIGEFRGEVNQRFSDIELVLKEHSKSINELKSDVGVLKSDVGVLKSDVGVLKTDVGVLKSDVGDLRGEMKDMESRLSRKIDTIGERVEDHEVRITTLESSRPHT